MIEVVNTVNAHIGKNGAIAGSRRFALGAVAVSAPSVISPIAPAPSVCKRDGRCMRKPSIGSPERESRRVHLVDGETKCEKRNWKAPRTNELNVDDAVRRDVDLL
ncbi:MULTISPECIES: hypothetical protein [Burkholderia]|uniref:hypothetical protein n=1 Tax=Burkholderia TaxID=32008 RepID=UPI001CF7AFBC|nr:MULTISPECIES: hypothetical protein [Burkholderia]